MRTKLLVAAVLIATISVFIPSPAFHHWLRYSLLEFLRPVLEPLLRFAVLPVSWFVDPLTRAVPRDWQFASPIRQSIIWLGLVVFCVFWWTVITRLNYVIGLWDPFRSKAGRPLSLVAAIKIKDWWEILTRFGRESTGGWAGFLEVLSNRYERGDIFLGRPRLKLGGGLLRPIGIRTEKHMVTLAGTGAGKSSAALIPNLCIHQGSLLCVDPKGELAMLTAARRGEGGGGVRGMGQQVHVLDPFSITGMLSASYNVFDEMARIAERDIDAPIAYASKVSEALVEISSHDPFWDRAARDVIKGLVLYVFQGAPGKRNLMQMRRFLMEGDRDAFEAGVRNGDINPKRNDPFDALLIAMQNCPAGPYKEAINYSASTILRMPENQRGSVLSQAQQHTAFLDLPEIQRVSATSDFLLGDLKNQYMSVYLSLPLNMVAGDDAVAKGWLRMFILLVIDMMFRNTTPCKHPLLLAIDEFPSLGKLDGIELVAPTLRSFGVRLWVVGQDIEGFKRTYPDSWGGFLGNAEAVQFLGIKHPDSVKMIVEFLGKHVVQRREGTGKDRRIVKEERNLLDANQVSQLLLSSRKNQIIWRGDRRPMILKVTPYFDYLPYWYYTRDRRYREKWNRSIWRRDDEPISPPPPDRKIQMPPDHSLPPVPPDRFRLHPPKDNMAKTDYSKFFPPKQDSDPKTPDPPKGKAGDWPDYLFKTLDPNPFGGLNIRGPNPLTMTKEEFEKYLIAKPRPDSPIPSKPHTPVGEILRPGRGPQLPPDVLSRLTPQTSALRDPLEELDDMIGLTAVKDQVKKTLSLILLAKARKKEGMRALPVSHHLVFTGNPGTGKTTVARIIGRIYQEHGLLKSGHLVETDRAGLIAAYQGQTALKVQKVVDQALDGVLFVDEAYNLVNSQGRDTYGAEAVATLLKLMEDKRDRLVVIAAGYRAEMKEFIDSNPGLSSRFKTYIDFPDYTPLEQMQILQGLCASADVQMSMDAMKKAADTLMALDHGKNFGNGRTIRNIFEECIARQATRLAERGQYGAVALAMIEADDIPEASDLHV